MGKKIFRTEKRNCLECHKLFTWIDLWLLGNDDPTELMYAKYCKQCQTAFKKFDDKINKFMKGVNNG